MKRRAPTLCCIAALAALSALGAPRPSQSAPSSHVDTDFITAAVQTDNAEMDMARLELQRGNGDEAMSFAKRMLADHQPIAVALARIAPSSVARVTEREGPGDRLALALLKALPPTDLDQQYLIGQVGGHLAAVSAYETEAAHGNNAALRAFATGTLPTLREHLEVAFEDARHVGGDNPLRAP